MRRDADRRGALHVLQHVVGEEGLLGRHIVFREHPREDRRIGLPSAIVAGGEQVVAEQIGQFGREGREMLAGEGFPIARRTVTKYREQSNLPVARLRRQIVLA